MSAKGKLLRGPVFIATMVPCKRRLRLPLEDDVLASALVSMMRSAFSVGAPRANHRLAVNPPSFFLLARYAVPFSPLLHPRWPNPL